MRISFKSRTECIGISFKRDTIVSTTREKPSNVQTRKLRNSKLPVLLDMYKFVE